MKKEKTVLIIATLDTKGPEALFVKKLIEGNGLRTLVMDIGTTGKSLFRADIPSHQVAEAVSRTLAELLAFNDEAEAMAEMAKGAESIVQGILKDGAFDGVIALGGSMGSSLVLRVFRGLPTGLTKVLVSTVAVSDFVTPQNVLNDVVLVQATCDLWGMNRLERRDLKKAALMVASMVESEEEPAEDSAPLITITTLGGSFLKYATPLKEALEKEGVVIPAGGFMEYGRPGWKLDYPEGRKAFIEALRDHLRPRIEFISMDCHINDPAYTDRVAEIALRLFQGSAA
ncbi:MAG: Tm-1-like ATP-binding domain-containing protein [Deltaproteobacteria bacterium]|nr:Tm-1-like ATP-binding domain-containing protein [Deltaproteobacteria bacterium]